MKPVNGGASAPEAVRAFVALDLDPMSVRRLARIAEHLRMTSGAPSATWTAPAKMHITLKFIAELPASSVVALGDAVSALASGKGPPRAGSPRLQAFPSVEEAEVIVAGLEDPDREILKLAQRTDKIGAKLGLASETRTFRPHVTLARLKRAYDARRWLRPDLAAGVGECNVTRLTLYRSDLGRDGSTHTALSSCSFVL